MKKKIFNITLTFMLAAFSATAFAQSTPPGANLPPPINASQQPQTKEGYLRVGASGSPTCVTTYPGPFPWSPPVTDCYRLDVLGIAYMQGLINTGLTKFMGTGLASGNNTAEFTVNNASANPSYVHYGTTGDWYIRSALPSGKVIIQDTGGNVGVGTTSPSKKLTVSGAALFSDGIYLGDSNQSVRYVSGAGIRLGTYQAPDAVTINDAGTQGGVTVSAGSVNIGGHTSGTPNNYRLNVNGLAHANKWAADNLSFNMFKFSEIYNVVWVGYNEYTIPSNAPYTNCDASTLGTILMANGNPGTGTAKDFLVHCAVYPGSPAYYYWEAWQY
jgi:hypothetical protein